MINFKNAENLVKFIEDKLPQKIHENLFYSKHQLTSNDGKSHEGSFRDKPFFIYTKLRDLGFAHGVCDDEYNFFPNTYVLHWTDLLNFLKQNDVLTHETKHYSLLTINEACEFLSITRPTLYKLINNGEIPFIQVLTQKRIQIKDLLNYIARNKK